MRALSTLPDFLLFIWGAFSTLRHNWINHKQNVSVEYRDYFLEFLDKNDNIKNCKHEFSAFGEKINDRYNSKKDVRHPE
jgi:hypothetical protein